MKMTTRIAYDNMKYHKSKNILIGIAIALTTLLLFLVPTVGKGIIDMQIEDIKMHYPSWHALYENIDDETADKLSAHHDISKYGLMVNMGIINAEYANVSMVYLDETGVDLYTIRLADGALPIQENDIVVSPGILEALGLQGGIGDVITIPFQINQNGGLDYTRTKEFRICGLIEESAEERENNSYISLISEAFLRSKFPKEQIAYHFLFRINDADVSTTDEIEGIVKRIAQQFGIAETNISINRDYLLTSYIDPAYVPGVIIIMLIVVLAGIITIYSIYYVSMNQRVQEFGRLKAIGATKRQVRQIVLREGFCVAAFAVPVGLLIGTGIARLVLFQIGRFFIEDEIIKAVNIYHWWIYLLAAAVAFGSIYASLAKPMRMAAKVSEVEAMRYYYTVKKPRSRRKGYRCLTIRRLTERSLAENKKKSVITILSMALTGMFFMIVATVLSCANPLESANSSILGQYEISPIVMDNNKEHPEWGWNEVVKDNLLNADLLQQIEQLEGVEHVDVFSSVRVSSDIFAEGEYHKINGVSEAYAKKLEDGIIKGKVTYEELKSGDKVIADSMLTYWYPSLQIGDQLNLTIYDGDRTYEKVVEIAAIGEYDPGFTNYNLLLMAKEAADALCEYSADGYFHIFADQDYDQTLMDSLYEIVTSSGRLKILTWQQEYESWKLNMALVSAGCYAFLGILAAISVMNLINTMINSVHVRKKELGMMQAIGMSDRQLMGMLQMEGLFYTLGTLLISVGLGSLLGYPVFRYAKWMGLFQITTYHYPVTAAVVVSTALLLIQLILVLGIAASLKRDSLIERIRFSE